MTTLTLARQIRSMARAGQAVRVSRKVQHPVGIEQLLLKDGQDAYYTEGEWANHSHLLKDHREGVGDLRMQRSGRAWLFDGVDDYGSAGTGINSLLSGGFTFSGVMNLSSYGTTQGLLANYDGDNGTSTLRDGIQFRIGSTGLEIILFYNSGSNYIGRKDSSGPYALGPHYFAATWDGTLAPSGFKLYLDGAQVDDTDLASGTVTAYETSNPLEIGRLIFASGPTGYIQGSLKDIRVYNAALTAAQVRALHNGDYHGSPVLDLPCEEESGNIGFDASGNENHVMFSGITQSTFHAVDSTVPTSRANEVGFNSEINLSHSGGSWADVDTWIGDTALPGDFEITYRLVSATSGIVFGVQAETQAAATDNYNRMDYAVQPLSTSYRFWRQGAFTSISEVLSQGDLVKFSRVGTDVTVHVNGVQKKIWTGQADTTMYPTSTLSGAASTRVLPVSGAGLTNSLHLGSGVTFSRFLIPRAVNAVSDARGEDLQFTGKAPNPGKYLAPVVTGNGTDVYVDAGQALIPPSADFELDMYVLHVIGATHTIFSQSASGLDEFTLLALNFGSVANRVEFKIEGQFSLRMENGTQAGWNRVRVIRTGNTYTVKVNRPDGTEVSASDGSTVNLAQPNSRLLANSNGSQYAASRLGYCRITTEGVTKHVLPRAETRTVDILGDDGSAATGSISGGTLSSIYANRGDGSWVDPRVKHGGQYIGQNFSPQSESAGSSWTRSNVTITHNVENAPNGELTADLCQPTGSNSSFLLDVPVIAGTDYTFSLWVKSATGDNETISIRMYNTDFTVLFGSTTVVATNEWQRFSVTGNPGANTTIRFTVGTGSTWSTGEDVYIWGTQIEQGSSPGLYSKTTGTAQTDPTQLIPTKLDGSEYADGSAIDTEATAHVPAQKLGDPSAAVDRQASNANTPFADASEAPTTETVASDPKTETSTKCRSRTIALYKDRLGSSRSPQTRQLANSYYGD